MTSKYLVNYTVSTLGVFCVLLCSGCFTGRKRERENRKIHENLTKSTQKKENDFVVGIMSITVQFLSLGLSLVNFSLELMEGGRVRIIIPRFLGRNPSLNSIVHV